MDHEQAGGLELYHSSVGVLVYLCFHLAIS